MTNNLPDFSIDYNQTLAIASQYAEYEIAIYRQEKANEKLQKHSKPKFAVQIFYSGTSTMFCPLRQESVDVLIFEFYDPRTLRTNRQIIQSSCSIEWSEFYKRHWAQGSDTCRGNLATWLNYLGKYLSLI